MLAHPPGADAFLEELFNRVAGELRVHGFAPRIESGPEGETSMPQASEVLDRTGANAAIFLAQQGEIFELHDACHGGERDIITAFTMLNLTGYAKVLDKLTADKDVNGQTLLDSSCILGISEYGEGYTHSNTETPVIMAGKAGGALETGWHVREEGGNLARAHLTCLRAVGINLPSYGFNGGETSSALPFLKA